MPYSEVIKKSLRLLNFPVFHLRITDTWYAGRASEDGNTIQRPDQSATGLQRINSFSSTE